MKKSLRTINKDLETKLKYYIGQCDYAHNIVSEAVNELQQLRFWVMLQKKEHVGLDNLAEDLDYICKNLMGSMYDNK